MANEMRWRGLVTGATNYFTICAPPNSYWHTDGTPGLETGQAAHWANYAITAGEVSGFYLYLGTIPATLPVGWYWIEEYRQAGGSPAITDTMVGQKYCYWDGTTLEAAAADVKQVARTAQTARDLGATLGAAGAGLTALGDARLANLDVAVSTRGTGAALAAQDVANALKLAPAAGAPASGSAQEALNAIVTTAIAELTSDPGATPAGIIKALMLLYMKARNAETTTATAKTVKNSAGTTVLTHTLSDDGSTFTKGKLA